jgi:hypothetical protein
MPPRRPQYTQESIDQHLQQIHLLDQSSSSENLEQLGPIIKQIHANRQQEAYLRTVQGLIESKDAEIERICGENYQDFISSVSTLFSIKSHTTVLSNKISSLDASVSQVGHGLVEKKRALLQCKKTAANLDEAIDTLQACLRVLDVVHRVGEMVKERKYWSALRVGRHRKAHFDVLMQGGLFSVSGRYPKHAPDFAFTDSVVPAFSILASIVTDTNQRRSDRIDKTMAMGYSKRQRSGWKARD